MYIPATRPFEHAPYDITGRPSWIGEILSKLAIIDKNLKKLSKINEIDA